MHKRDHLRIAKQTSQLGQNPIAIVLSCIDSRSEPAIIFDQGMGNIFSAAVAGNIISYEKWSRMDPLKSSAQCIILKRVK